MAQTINSDEHRSDLSTTEARQAITIGRMRYVLGISTVLVALAFFVIWLVVYTPS